MSQDISPTWIVLSKSIYRIIQIFFCIFPMSEGEDGDGCDNRGTGMAVMVAIQERGDVGGDRNAVDDAVSVGILDSDGDGITSHRDNGVIPISR